MYTDGLQKEESLLTDVQTLKSSAVLEANHQFPSPAALLWVSPNIHNKGEIAKRTASNLEATLLSDNVCTIGLD